MVMRAATWLRTRRSAGPARAVARARRRRAVLWLALGLVIAACSTSPLPTAETTTVSERAASDTTVCAEAVVDGTTASDSAPPGTASGAGPPGFVATTGDAVFTSNDGLCWTRQAIELGGSDAGPVDGEVRFVIAADEGTLIVSDHGHRWVEVSVENDSLLGISAFAYGNGRHVGVGTVCCLTATVSAVSDDGIDWAHKAGDLPHGFASVTFATDRFFAVGPGLIASSEDGVDWTRLAFDAPRQLFDIAYGGGRFVAVGGLNAIYSSLDGVNWNEESSGLSRLFGVNSVTYGNGMFVAVGSEFVDRGEFVSGEGYGAERPTTKSTIISSEDGVAWSIRHTDTSQSLGSVAYGNNRFVAVGSNRGPVDEWGNDTSFNAVILTSTDGTEWTAAELGGPLKQHEDGYYTSSFDDPDILLRSVTSWPTASQ